MGEINTDFLNKCIATLEKSYKLLKKSKPDTIDYEMYRNSLVKAFEMTLEQSGKLLRKKITPYFPSKKAVDALNFKDLFRHASKRGLLSGDEAAMWFKYRDNRNNTAHDYGEAFAEETLSLIDGFVKSAKRLKKIIENE
ncbi:MAG: nucleotidyltransferase substrate binding protein [Elusimicrobiota bacterium]|jgi:nucleotidyltransferase substrate binding protein (TIGR01987 family)|nr:nucleotidyltransferase substrate binding protein [Elusimicrobiota bacterium]